MVTAGSNLDKNYGAPWPRSPVAWRTHAQSSPGDCCRPDATLLLGRRVVAWMCARTAGITAKIDEQLKLSQAIDKAGAKVEELKGSVTSKVCAHAAHAHALTR